MINDQVGICTWILFLLLFNSLTKWGLKTIYLFPSLLIDWYAFHHHPSDKGKKSKTVFHGVTGRILSTLLITQLNPILFLSLFSVLTVICKWITSLSEEAGWDAELLCQARTKRAAHLLIIATSPVAGRWFSHHPFGSHTSRAVDLPYSAEGMGLWPLPISICPLWKRYSLHPGRRFPLFTPMGISIWWLQGEQWQGRNSAAG